MEQLLKITNIPIKVDFKVQRASLEHNTQRPTVNISRERGGLKIEAKPIQIQIDTKELRSTIGMKGMDRLTRDFAQKGIQSSYEAIAKIVQNGDRLMNGISDTQKCTPSDLAKQTALNSIETVLDFIPKVGPDISWKDGTLSIQYTADDLSFKLNRGDTSFRFVPGDIRFNITQYPEVKIEYTGKPIYFPPSAMAMLGYGELNNHV